MLVHKPEPKRPAPVPAHPIGVLWADPTLSEGVEKPIPAHAMKPERRSGAGWWRRMLPWTIAVMLGAVFSAPAYANDISNWSEIDGDNTAPPPNGWPAGMLPTQVEPTAQAMMGAIKRWYDAPVAANTSDVELYVAPTGSDTTNNCQTYTAPCLTIGHATAGAYQANAGGQNVQINIFAGAWAQDIIVAGRLPGAGGPAVVPAACSGSSCAVSHDGQIIYDGGWNGATCTGGCGTPSGTTTISSSGSYCGTVIASDYAIIGLENITFTGNANGCESTLFAQLGATINLYGGNVWGAATVGIWHSENPGSSIQIWANQTVTGGASQFATFGSNSAFIQSYGTIFLSGSPSFGTFLYGSDNATYQWNVGTPFSGAISGGAQPFSINSNAAIQNTGFIGVNVIPGLTGQGEVGSGGRVNYMASCVGGAVGCYATVTPTGLGSGGSAATSGNATPYGGTVVLTAGSGALTQGTVQLGLGYRVYGSGQGQFNNCIAHPVQYSASWQATAVIYPQQPGNNGVMSFNWYNGTTPLVSGDAFYFTFVCQGG